ncbi:MAG: NAD(P)H-hydrate dehydratase [Patescibacteria group bacterium]|jgi:NAD(P)H-hydrate epimerase
MSKKSFIKKILKKRPKISDKSKFGHVLVIAGSKCMPGAALLTAKAAMKAGAGLVTMAHPKSLLPIFVKSFHEAIHLLLPETKIGSIDESAWRIIVKNISRYNVIALGPGLGRCRETARFAIQIIKKAALPLVIDANGLNAMAELKKTWILNKRIGITILTPHQGELKRLIDKPISWIAGHRLSISKKLAKEWNSIIVLKGNGTIVCSPDGRVFKDTLGGPELATAGTGDVLTGIISSFVAQHPGWPFEAVVAAVQIHSLAGRLAKRDLGEYSVTASDLLEYLPKALTIQVK